jgi:hypothetical protein
MAQLSTPTKADKEEVTTSESKQDSVDEPTKKPPTKKEKKSTGKTKKSLFFRIVMVLVLFLAAAAVFIYFSPTVQKGGNSLANPSSSTGQSPSGQVTSTYTNGHHLVGVEITPGVYRGEVEEGTILLCSVSQTDKDGEVLDVQSSKEGSVIFTVVDIPESHVTFQGCTNIGLAQENLRANPATITNGYYLVGDEIPAGTYRGVVDTEAITVLATATQSDARGFILAVEEAVEGELTFEIKDTPGSVVSFIGFSQIVKI